MEKFYLEIPSLERKEEAIEYIKEFYQYKSEVVGDGYLRNYLDNYAGWLNELGEVVKKKVSETEVPKVTYFLIRSNDNKIIGMINIRLALNEKLRNYAGHIGYSIRPTERKKGYNKINLYLGLKVCAEHNIKEALLGANEDNPASWRTMEALGGILTKKFYNEEKEHDVRCYKINVSASINKYKDIYGKYIEEDFVK